MALWLKLLYYWSPFYELIAAANLYMRARQKSFTLGHFYFLDDQYD